MSTNKKSPPLFWKTDQELQSTADISKGKHGQGQGFEIGWAIRWTVGLQSLAPNTQAWGNHERKNEWTQKKEIQIKTWNGDFQYEKATFYIWDGSTPQHTGGMQRIPK